MADIPFNQNQPQQQGAAAAPVKPLGPHDNMPPKEQEVADHEVNLRKAAEKAWHEAPLNTKGAKQCPWCGFDAIYGNDEDKEPFKYHFQAAHRSQLAMYWANPDLGFDAQAILNSEEDDLEEWKPEGLDVTDSLDGTDYLYIPEAIKKEYLKNGGRFYWTSPQKAQYWIDRGLQLVQRPTGDDLEKGDTPTGARSGGESNRLTANELTLLYTPERIAQQRDRAKAKASLDMGGGLAASKEAAERRKSESDIGNKAYEYFRKNHPNMSHENRMRMAAQVERNYHEGGHPTSDGPTRREPGENVYTHRR